MTVKKHAEDKVWLSKTEGSANTDIPTAWTFEATFTAVALTSLLYRDVATPIVHTAKTEELFYFFSSRLHFCSEFFFPRSQGRLRANAIVVISFPHVQYKPSRTRWTDTLLTGRALRKLRNRSGAGGKRKEGGRRIERSYFLPLLWSDPWLKGPTDQTDRETWQVMPYFVYLVSLRLIWLACQSQHSGVDFNMPSALLLCLSRMTILRLLIPGDDAPPSLFEWNLFLCEYNILPRQCHLIWDKKNLNNKIS